MINTGSETVVGRQLHRLMADVRKAGTAILVSEQIAFKLKKLVEKDMT